MNIVALICSLYAMRPVGECRVEEVVLKQSVIAAVGFLFVCSGAAASGLTGADRTSFVNSSIPSCVKSAVASGALAKFTDQQIQAYCECYASKLADTLTEDDMTAIEADPSHMLTRMGSRMDAAASACRPGN